MARTKGAKGKKAIKAKIEKPIVAEVTKEVINEVGYFGNEEMHILIDKVNEVIKFINK
jgi:hypothetical protein